MLAENLRMRFTERTIATQERVTHLMEISGRDTWNCDPEPSEYRHKGMLYSCAAHQNHSNVNPLSCVLGVSNQVTRLLQGYVDNEVNLNESNDCKKKCTDYTLTRNYQCYNGSLCDPAREDPFIKKCNGQVVNCQFIEGDMKICPSVADRSRSYNFITLSSGTVLGKGGSCEAEESEVRWRTQFGSLFVLLRYNLFIKCFRRHLGLDGLFNVRIASVTVTKKAEIPTDISVSNLCSLTPIETCKTSCVQFFIAAGVNTISLRLLCNQSWLLQTCYV